MGPSPRWGLGFAAHPRLSEPTESQAVQVGSRVTGWQCVCPGARGRSEKRLPVKVQEDRTMGPNSSGPGEARSAAAALSAFPRPATRWCCLPSSQRRGGEALGPVQGCPAVWSEGTQGQDVGRSPPAGPGVTNGFMRTNSNPRGHPGAGGEGGVSTGAASGSWSHLSVHLNLLGRELRAGAPRASHPSASPGLQGPLG